LLDPPGLQAPRVILARLVPLVLILSFLDPPDPQVILVSRDLLAPRAQTVQLDLLEPRVTRVLLDPSVPPGLQALRELTGLTL
jgi:hypothetical protein